MPVCVECGNETPRDDMFGIGKDLRCPNCAGKRRQVYAPAGKPTLRVDGWITKTMLVVSGFLFFAGDLPIALLWPGQAGDLESWLIAFSPKIWDGQLWRLVTSCFLHGDFMHILFNGLALWQIGPVIEAYLGRWRYVGFCLALAIASLGTQLAISVGAVVGLSGIIFGMFGYLYSLRKTKDFAAAFMTPATVQNMVFFFFLFFALDALGVMRVGHWAHAGGGAVGWLIGYSSIHRQRKVLIPLTLLLALVLGSLAYWMPWNADFCLYQAQKQAIAQNAGAYQDWLSRARVAPFPPRLFAPNEFAPP
jgi:membrane associated rhomboid family serine protease